MALALATQVREDGRGWCRMVILLLVGLPATTGVPMLISAMLALVILLATGCISVRTIRRSVNGSVLVVIGSAFGIAQALETSGAADLLAQFLTLVTSSFGPIGILAGIYLIGVLCACLMSNVASAALIFPVAMNAAATAGLRAFFPPSFAKL